MAPTALTIEALSFQYRSGAAPAISAIDLAVEPGQLLLIAGPSGCGKSTLLMLLSGLIPVSSGSIRVAGRPVDGPVHEAGIVFQRDVLLDWRSVLSNVMLPGEIKKLDHKSHERKALELRKDVGFPERAERIDIVCLRSRSREIERRHR